MARPAKSVKVLKSEKKSHRTKAELSCREKAEDNIMSGVEIREHADVKRIPAAHKEFIRIRKLFKNIGKNDAMYEAVLNRYALIHGECVNLENDRENIRDLQQKLNENDGEYEFDDYMARAIELQKQLAGIDRQLHAKRRMLMEIEKENAMTIKSALRIIPKKEAEEPDPVLKLLGKSG